MKMVYPVMMKEGEPMGYHIKKRLSSEKSFLTEIYCFLVFHAADSRSHGYQHLSARA